MSDWASVGNWLKAKGGDLLGLAGAVATGNIPAGVAAVASLVSEATGETDPTKALVKLQSTPELELKLQELLKRDEADIRAHHRAMLQLQLEDTQKGHKEQQDTIRNGDNASDEYVRRTRPMMARQSWYATLGYILCFEVAHAAKYIEKCASMEIALVLLAPAGAYLGFRTADKIWNKK